MKKDQARFFHKAAAVLLPAVVSILCFLCAGAACAWEDESTRRPFISGRHDWKYNKFSSYDQLRINFEKEFNGGQKFYSSIHGLYYQEDNNKSWNAYVGETYFKMKTGRLDLYSGLLLDTLGSGDKISFVDKINSRRFYNGLANDYNRDKKEVAAVKGIFFLNKSTNFTVHYLPYFMASEVPNIYSRWATAFQKALASAIVNGATLNQEAEKGLEKDQYHFSVNTMGKRSELRFHYFRLKERLPVIEETKPAVFHWTYPLDETFALDGNVNLDQDSILRFEAAYNRNKTFSSFQNGRIGKKFFSDQYSGLFGTDRSLPNNFYLNLQCLFTYIPDLETQTPYQLKALEFLSTLQLRQGFRNETLFIEFNALKNLSSGEYVLTPQIQLLRGDFLKFIAGLHLNGESTEGLGPIGQFNQNNTMFFETQVVF